MPKTPAILLLFLLMLSIGNTAFAQKIKIDLEAQYQKGLRLIRAGQFEKAIDPLYECYRIDVNNINLASQVAYCYMMTGNNREAKFFYKDILKKDSINLGAISNLAQIYEREANLQKAREYYLQLIEIDTTNSYYYKQNGTIALRMGLYQEAGAYYSKAYHLNPKDITVIDHLASIYLDLNAVVYADTFSRRALNLDPQNIRALQTFAKVQHEQKNYEEVILAIRNCMTQGDSSTFYQKMLANALLRIDSLDASIERLMFILSRNKQSEYTYHNLAVAYELKEQPDSAVVYYSLAIEDAVSKQYPMYCESLAQIKEKQKDYKAAIQLFQEAYNHSEESELLFHLARNYELYYKDKQMAIRQYQRYLASSDEKYRQYSTDRVRLLKEIVHQQGKR